MLVELGYVSLYWPSLSLILFCPRMINRTKDGLGRGVRKTWEFKKERDIFFRLSACLSGSQTWWRCQAGCSASHGGSNWGIGAAGRAEAGPRQGWAGPAGGERGGCGGGGGGGGGTLRGFGSALIRVIITAGAHTNTHTLALVFAAGVSPDSRGFPWSEVITCPAILHGALRYHSGCRINSLSSLCERCFLVWVCICVYVCV